MKITHLTQKKVEQEGNGNKEQMEEIGNDSKMVNFNPTISVITLNISSYKRQRVSYWIQKQVAISSLQETHFKCKDRNRLKVRNGKLYTIRH